MSMEVPSTRNDRKHYNNDACATDDGDEHNDDFMFGRRRFSELLVLFVAFMMGGISVNFVSIFKPSETPQNQYLSSSRVLLESPTTKASPSTENQYPSSSRALPELPTTTENQYSAPSRALQTTQFFGSKVRFIFTVGLEGVGHHALDDLIESSPAAQKIIELDLKKYIGNLSTQLFSWNRVRLFNAHCKFQEASEIDVRENLNLVVKTLKTVEEQAAAKASSSEDEQIVFMVNPWASGRGVGELSYPNYAGQCRSLNYPNVDLLYQACELAEVDCQHIIVYRDPLAILRSAQKRHFNKSKIQGIQIYTTMLKVVFALLLSHGSDRTAGCFGILDPNGNERDNKIWKAELGRLLGWKSPKEFYSVWDEKFHAPQAVPQDFQDKNAKFEPYMKSWYRVHEDVLNLCNEHMNAKRT